MEPAPRSVFGNTLEKKHRISEVLRALRWHLVDVGAILSPLDVEAGPKRNVFQRKQQKLQKGAPSKGLRQKYDLLINLLCESGRLEKA